VDTVFLQVAGWLGGFGLIPAGSAAPRSHNAAGLRTAANQTLQRTGASRFAL